METDRDADRHDPEAGGMDPAETPEWAARANTNLKVAEPSLFRGMLAAHSLRSFASVLADRPPTAQDYSLSSAVEHCDTFLSHNWGTPRWQKFLVLAFHYNLRAALLISTMVAASTCFLTAHGLLPSVASVSFFGAEEPAQHFHVQGLLCLPLGLASFLCSLFGIHELDRFRTPCNRQKLFLDRSCVCQTCPELKRQGIESLAAFLYHSGSMLVLLSDQYLQRLWTVYEVATWLMLHRSDRLTVRPLLVPIFILCGFLCFSFVYAYFTILHVTMWRWSQSNHYKFVLAAMLLVMVPAGIVFAWLGARLAAERDRIDAHVASFNLAEAKCASEADRDLVQGNICSFMKFAKLEHPDASDPEVLSAFDSLVRQEVPKLLRASTGRVGVPYRWAFVAAYPALLIGFDQAAGMLLESKPLPQMLLWPAFDLAIMFLIGPLFVALIVSLTRWPSQRGRLGWLGVGTFAAALLLAAFFLLGALTSWAETTTASRSLVVLAAAYVVLTAVTWSVYRPMPRVPRSHVSEQAAV